jgi:hypothetical protein
LQNENELELGGNGGHDEPPYLRLFFSWASQAGRAVQATIARRLVGMLVIDGLGRGALIPIRKTVVSWAHLASPKWLVACQKGKLVSSFQYYWGRN